jgi:hypothetical protein
MKIERTEDEKECIAMAKQVDFLETKEEYELYAGALLAAKKWGEKVDKQNKKNSNKSVLNVL